MKNPLLSLRQIQKSYQKGKNVLLPFDLDIAENEIFFHTTTKERLKK